MPEDKKNDAKNKERRQYSALLEASTIGMVFPIAIGLGYLWGLGLDKWLGTAPWCTVIFTVFGVIAGFLNLFRAALRSDGTRDESGDAGKRSGDAGDDRYDAS